MARFLVALCSSLFFFALTLAIGRNLAAAILVAVFIVIVLFFTLCVLEMAHLGDEAASKFRKSH